MNNRFDNHNLILRGFQDPSDFNSIASIRNKSAMKHYGSTIQIIGFIATLGVIPAFQGQGFGSLLMEKAITHLWRSGVRNVDLSVRVKNPKAIGVYEHFGFQAKPNKTTLVLKKDL